MAVGAAWDYIVVGGGSAGATLAARLSEFPERRVLLLEAGGADWSPNIHIPGMVEQLITSRTLNWHFEGEPDPSLGGRRLTWAAGRVLGGSSSINGMVYGRGLPADYDAWVQAGHDGWGWNDMLPSFRKMECWSGAPNPARGTDGPLQVRPFTQTNAACRAAMDRMIANGLPFVEDYSVGISQGIGLTQATQTGRWRHSVARAYLRPARRRPNLRVVTRARADRLLIERGRCTGVIYTHQGTQHTARAEREMIVCAGAIGSPKLLLLSGIGAPEALVEHGIAVTHALPGVGRNLNDHVNIKISAFVDTPTYNTQRRGLAALRHGADLLARGRGPATSPANHCQAFVKTEASLAVADVQIQLMALGFGTPEEMRRDGMTAVVSPCRPEARGAVTLRSADPAEAPRVTMSMLSREADVVKLLRGCRTARAALEGTGRLYAPHVGVSSDADWLAFFRETAALNWHPTSTCRMGDVVDAQLRVLGLSGLSIADASVMPSVVSGNTNAPVIAIAERAAVLIACRTT